MKLTFLFSEKIVYKSFIFSVLKNTKMKILVWFREMNMKKTIFFVENVITSFFIRDNVCKIFKKFAYLVSKSRTYM